VPLSNNRVITLLNRYFVPVYTANEDYRDGGSASPEERAELERIHREGHAKKLSVGSVHAYVLGPDGELVDSLHVAEAFKIERLISMLEGSVSRLGTAAAEPVVKPASQSAPPAAAGELVLHLTARYLERKGDAYSLIEDAGGNWSAFPGEDWIRLSKAQWSRLMPPVGAKPGATWEIAPDTAKILFNRFYPPTENNNLSKNRIERQSLKGTILSVNGRLAVARLEGSLKMSHPFYHKEDGKQVEAGVIGYLRFDPRTRQIRTLQLVTDEAHYGAPSEDGQPFGVVVRSLP
jgi:hypothetical protein